MIPLSSIQTASRAVSPPFPAQITLAIVAGAFSVLVLAINMWVFRQKDRDDRRRDVYSKAFAAVEAYKEFPYVVRRRRGDGAGVAAEERARISEDLRHVQEQLSYYSAWMATESKRLAVAYRHLVAETRRIAGAQIHEAWLQPPATADEAMNMPDLGLRQLGSAERAYLDAVADHLSCWPGTRWRGFRAAT